MQETTGLLDKIKHHDKLPILINENCAVALPKDVVQQLCSPHKLSYYYFMFVDKGSADLKADAQDISITDGQLAFALPNQVFTHLACDSETRQYKVAFDENTVTLLPNAYPFLANPFNKNVIIFDPAGKQRVKSLFSTLFQLLHSPGKHKNTEIILAHLHTLLTELNSAYFEQYGNQDIHFSSRLSKYMAFKLAVETHLTEQHDVHTIAEQLATSTSRLYGIVKEFSGVSPKEWMTNQLMLEARRKLQYSSLSAKEIAYELGFSDPDYFSRLFKKSTGKSISSYLSELRDLSGK